MGPVALEQTVQVASLVDEFNRLGKTSKEPTKSDMMLDCEMEIKGIVKKVVKFFNEFAERQIQSKTKRQQVKRQRKLKERLQRKKEELAVQQPVVQSPVIQYVDPSQIMRDSIRVPTWQWRLQGGRRPIKLKDGTELKLTDQPICDSYNEARDALRRQLPGDQIYHKRDYFQRLPDHILVSIFSHLRRVDLSSMKLVCRDFNWIIQYFDIIAFDSGWRPGLLYREDRCKWCKRKRTRGDASVCRYHPKSFVGDPVTSRCFYMCCQKQNKMAPGCKKRDQHDNFLVEARRTN